MSGNTSSTAKLVVFELSEWKPAKGRVFNRKVYFLPDGEQYSVFVAELPGCASQGDTYEEAKANIREALHGVIESYLAMGEKIPVREDSTPEGAMTCIVSIVIGGD